MAFTRRFHVITVFPEMVQSALRFGVVGQGVQNGKIVVRTVNPRDFTSDAHHSIDDRPFGGGDGMVMLAEPLSQALKVVRSEAQAVGQKLKVIHLSPRGQRLDDQMVRRLSEFPGEIALIASRYGGVDQRFLNAEVDEEISLGDYVLSGGEIAALVLIDAIGRRAPGIVGNPESIESESFAPGADGTSRLEHPQFTRPREWQSVAVPQIFFSGDHAKIAAARTCLATLVTLERRPDLAISRTALYDALSALQKFNEQDLSTLGLRASAMDLRDLLQTRIKALESGLL